MGSVALLAILNDLDGFFKSDFGFLFQSLWTTHGQCVKFVDLILHIAVAVVIVARSREVPITTSCINLPVGRSRDLGMGYCRVRP